MSEHRNERVSGARARATLTFRCRGDVEEALRTAAQASGCSLSEEIERRLEASFAAQDMRQIVREEIRAALNSTASEA